MVGVRRWTVATAAALAALGCTVDAPPQRAATPAAELPADWPHRPEHPAARGARTMVTTDAPIATEVGVAVLEAGGNAVDAAVATAFALAVVYPEAGNIGGGGFMVVRTADGEAAALDFRETAPAAATRDMYLDDQGELTGASITGHLAAGVPGTVAGLWEAHRRYGVLPWAEVLEPAIGLAEHGFPADERFVSQIRGQQNRLGRFPASAELFLAGGTPPRVGETWRNPDLAATLRRIVENGAAGFYEGETADLIVAEMRRGGGIITHGDLQSYEARWRDPVVFRYRGHTVVSMPPPSSGGMTLAMIANILEAYDVGAMGWNTPEKVHLVAEAMRRAFADRNHYIGDPDFVEIPRERLMSRAYAEERRATIGERATPSGEVTPGPGAGPGADHTTHFGIVDEAGNAVALTTTVNGFFGSAVTVAGAGFLLNNEMDDFTAKPGEPNMYGLIQGEANAIEPGKRMLSAMSPTVVVGPNGQTLLVTGARGGPRIITAVFQVLSNVIDHGMDGAAAVRVPRIHHQHLPDILYFEAGGLTAAQIASLEALGHVVQPRSGYIGHAPTILKVEDGWRGVVDPRQGGLARGF